ncbi:MAG: hypothetical protein IJ154_01965 [Bacteroidales bacterium]|nr:hypothetical protein [Bacteroidales bacterium]
MKKTLVLLACAALLLSCGGNNQNEGGSQGDNGNQGDGGGKSNISIGNKFAFAGLESDKLVPDFAIELSELATDPRSESKPMKDEVFFYTGNDITAIPAAKVQAYLQKVYAAVKKAADGEKVYKAKGISGDELGEEITEAPTTDKPSATIMYLYQHNGVWFNISVGHKAYFRQFKKDYGEKFIGVGVTVKEMLGSVQ